VHETYVVSRQYVHGGVRVEAAHRQALSRLTNPSPNQAAHRQALLQVDAHQLAPIALVESPIDLGQHTLRRFGFGWGFG